MRNGGTAILASTVLVLGACATSPEATLESSTPVDAPLLDNRPLEEQFVEAIGANDAPRIEALVDAGLDVNVNLNPIAGFHTSALDVVGVWGTFELIDVIVENGYDLDATDPTIASEGRAAMHAAAATGDVAFMSALLAAGASIDVHDGDGNTPFQWALYNGKVPAAEYLLGEGADINHVDNRDRNSADMAHKGGFQDSQDFVARLGLTVSGADIP